MPLALTDAQKMDLTTHRYSRAVISRVNMPSSSTYQSPMSILIAGNTRPDGRDVVARIASAQAQARSLNHLYRKS